MTAVGPFECLLRVVNPCLFIAVAVCGHYPSAVDAANPPQSAIKANVTQHFYCSTGYDPQQCKRHVDALRAVLVHYPTDTLGDWSWVVVRSQDWRQLLLRLRLDPHIPALSALGQHVTLLEEELFVPNTRASSQLVRNFQVPFDQLLSLAVSHEMAHVVCQEMNEAAARRIAEQLRTGKRSECGPIVSRESLSRIDELYLHGRSLSLNRRR